MTVAIIRRMLNDYEPPLLNPYHHDYGDDVAGAPFAGRQAIFGRLYQHLARSDRRGGLCLMGRRHSGKSALLYAIKALFSDNMLPVIVSLKEIPIDNDTGWVLAWAQNATAALVEYGYSVTRLNALEAPESDALTWFEQAFIPLLLSLIRGSRRLLWLIDDADQWLTAIRTGALPADHIQRTHNFIAQHESIDLVLTLDSEHEVELMALSPLIGLTDVIRLSNLTREDAEWLLREPVRNSYTVTDQAVQDAHQLTGGTPGLIQQVGYLLYRRWSNEQTYTSMMPDDIKAASNAVYTYGERDFIESWRALNGEERLVLTAISSITYTDPVARIDAPTIEAWLIETDYPLDVVAINAALRGLEYREAVALAADGAIRINGDAFQRWLIEHARLGERVSGAGSHADRRAAEQRRARVDVTQRLATRQKPNTTSNRANSVRLILLFGLALLISTVVLIASVVSTPRTPPTPDAQPTATLITLP